MCRMFEKVAEHWSKVPPLAKQVSLLVFKTPIDECLKNLLSGLLERDGGISGYEQSVIQDTIYKPSTTRRNNTPILGC